MGEVISVLFKCVNFSLIKFQPGNVCFKKIVINYKMVAKNSKITVFKGMGAKPHIFTVLN